MSNGYYLLSNMLFPHNQDAIIDIKPLPNIIDDYPTIVTTEADDGYGSLREVIYNAPQDCTITFASNVTNIILTSGEIEINRSLTINGGSNNEKVTISGNNNSRIFFTSNSINLNINNLILTNGYKTLPSSNGSAVYVSYNSNLTATNCTFCQNSGNFGGAIHTRGNNNFTATNCTFNENRADYNGGAIYFSGSCYLYHCTFEGNSCNNSNGGGAIYKNDNLLYSYNCIYVNNSEKGSVTTAGQINGTITAGDNLIHNGTTITSATVFGTNQFTTDGYIVPLDFAKSATRLTTATIHTSDSIDATEIIN
jgi:predicted outer membrane repeat protein